MNILKNIFGLGDNRSSSKREESPKQPEIQDFSDTVIPELKTHVDTVNYEFSFLSEDLGFTLMTNRFFGRELCTIYSKENIDVNIFFELGSLPIIKIRNNDLPYDESKSLFNADVVEDYNIRMKEIRSIRGKRRNPKQQRFMDEWLDKDNLNLTELDEDYDQFGRQEHIEYLQEAAKTVRENIENRKGKLKNAP